MVQEKSCTLTTVFVLFLCFFFSNIQAFTFFNKTPYTVEINVQFVSKQPDFKSSIAPHADQKADFGKAVLKSMQVNVAYGQKNVGSFTVTDFTVPKRLEATKEKTQEIYFFTQQKISDSNELLSGSVVALVPPSDIWYYTMPKMVGKTAAFVLPAE